MTDNLHEYARQNTPENVEIPRSYAGLIVWAIGKWGIGVVFAAFLIPVYSDLKASNQRLANIAQANVAVLTALAAKIETTNASVERVDAALRNLQSNRITQ